MNWKRVSEYAGQSGHWTITEMIVSGVSSFLLYRKDEIIGKFTTKDAAKSMAESFAESERIAA